MRIQMTVAAPWQTIQRQLIRRLTERGFVPRTTFDLQLARRSLRNNEEVPCPHHGSGRCTCQYLVLQISSHGESPSAAVLHGHGDWTRIVLLSAAVQKSDEGTAAELCEALDHVRAREHGNPRLLHRARTGDHANSRAGST
jgi:hypothetical protein